MKLIIALLLITYSLSVIVFPFKIRENDAKTFASPINQTQIPILKYMYHILNDYEFVSDIEVGTPRQKVELLFNFNDEFLTLLYHRTSPKPYYYNLSSTYKEIKIYDKECPLKVSESTTIKEILFMKNKFYNNLNDFLSSKDEISHEFVIIFSKHLPTLKHIVTYQFVDSNAVRIGLQVNAKYNEDHGIYKPFINEMKEQGYIENYLHFIYFFDEYEENLYAKDNNNTYDGLIVLGKYPHELLPNKYDIKNLFWTNTFLTYTKITNKENIIWVFKFNQVYIDYGNNKKENFEYLRGIFDFNVDYIFPPYQYYETIKNFFRPLRKICFIDTNARLINKDDNAYRMVYCDYEEFGKKYLKTFPKLVFKIDDFNETFEFTYKDLFKPIYDNKYYLFLIFTGRFWRASEIIIQPPSYPWTLGKIFFKKYQFVFDALNKKVGYYKNKNTKNNKEPIVETNKNIENQKEEIENKQNDEDKGNNKKNNSTDLLKIQKPIKKDNIIINKKDSSIIDSTFIVIFGIVLSIIIALIVGICYEYKFTKKERKRRPNELIDDVEYNPKKEQKM
jgi:hypothetical protein